MTKKLTAAQQFILQLLEDKGSRHRDWIVDICKQRGYRVVNRSINSLVEQGYLSVDEDDYVTAARAELAALEPVASVSAEDAPLPDHQRYQAADKDAVIERLKRALEAVQRQLTDVDPEFWYLNVSNALWMIKHALNAEALPEQPAPKMTRRTVTVMPSIGDKVRIKAGAGVNVEARNLQEVGIISGLDGDPLPIKVQFPLPEDYYWFLPEHIEIVELGRDTAQGGVA